MLVLLALGLLAQGDALFTERTIATLPDGLALDGPSITAPDGTVHEITSRMHWSPDGLQVAYVGYRGSDAHPVIGDSVGKSHHYVDDPVFGPTGDAVVFRVGDRTSKLKEKWILYSGAGVKRPKKDDWIGAPSMSPDGERTIVWTQPGAKLGRDGFYVRKDVQLSGGWKRGKKWDDALCLSPPVFAPDGKRVFTAVQKAGRWSLLAVDKKGEKELEKDFDMILDVVAHPDGRKAAMTIRSMAGGGPAPPPGLGGMALGFGTARVQFDGATYGGAFDQSCAPSFSEDGRHIAYKIVDGGNMGVGVDTGKKAEATWDFVTLPIFSPAGKHVAYVGNRGSKLHAMMKTERFADQQKRGGKDRVVVADLKGKEKTIGDEAERIERIVWGPKKDQIAYAARTAGGWQIVCGEARSESYDEVGRPIFDSVGKRVAFGARSDRELLWRVLVLPD